MDEADQSQIMEEMQRKIALDVTSRTVQRWETDDKIPVVVALALRSIPITT